MPKKAQERSPGACTWTRSCVLAAALLGVLVAHPARAQEPRRRAARSLDVWSTPAPGVRYLHRTTSVPSEVHATVIDLGAPGVRLEATPHASRWSTVRERAQESDAEVTINGGFWGAFQRPLGLAAGGGELWSGSAPDPLFASFVVDDRGRARLAPPETEWDERSLSHVAQAVSGVPMLLRAGELAREELDAFATAPQRQPRTALGLSADRGTLVLVVVDGRRRASRGMDLYELAHLLAELGATDALNLDGGGSSEMFVRGAGGVVNVPSRGRWEAALDDALGMRQTGLREGADGGREAFVRGVEREVMNHLSVIAPSGSAMLPEAHASALSGTPAELPRPRAAPEAPRLRLGAAREWLVYVAPTSGCALVGVALWWWRRRRLSAAQGR